MSDDVTNAKGWRWMAGMRDTTGRMVVADADCGEIAWIWSANDGCEWLPVEGHVPDLADPATLGCLLALVREAWGTTAHLVRHNTNVFTADGTDTEPACWWAVAVGLASVPFYVEFTDGDYTGRRCFTGPTEAAALVAALLAAP
jgi:hypothetical protein